MFLHKGYLRRSLNILVLYQDPKRITVYLGDNRIYLKVVEATVTAAAVAAVAVAVLATSPVLAFLPVETVAVAILTATGVAAAGVASVAVPNKEAVTWVLDEFAVLNA